MRFVVDESAGVAVVEYLRAAGHDVCPVAEEMPHAEDAAILALSRGEDRVLVTSDKDFGELVFYGGRLHHGVLLLRLEDESPDNRLRVIRGVLEQHAARLPGGFVIATERGVRIRSA